ncbi:MAG: fimbrillin family protein [Tidjanibacter sp.]|nr:fimbrillin family protein [Tidjanibacter sp.]MBQ3071292.1 fimbrillin family protein [Tidjanibacter sp.]
MKLTKVFAALAMVAVATTACQNEPEAIVTPEQGAKVISVTPAFYSFNRATATAFEEGDQIGLHIITTDGAYLNNALYTFTGGALASVTPNYWYQDEEQVSDVLAYYPYNAQGAYSAEGYAFAVQADQSKEGAYAASDLLIAATTSKPTAEAVELPFKHAGSKIVVKINNESDDVIKDVYISDVYTAATFNLKSGEATVSGEKAIVKGAVAGNDWTMIVVPQQAVSPKLIVTTTTEGQYTFNIVAATDLVAGKVATATLNISKELVSTEFTPEISDWESNGDIEFNPSEGNTPGEGEEGGDDPIVPEIPFVSEASDLGVVGSFAASGWANDAVLYTTPTEGLLVAEGVELIANDAFKIRTVGVWDKKNYGRGDINYIKANKYITAVDGSSNNITVEAAGTYDIYFNVNTLVVYLMTAGTDIAEATEQTESGEEPVTEEPEVTENVLYLSPNTNWKADGARFAAYFFGDGEAWVSMTDSDADGIYEANIPVGGYTSVIFCRMNPNTTANNWDNKWNQTADLTVPTDGTNLYTVAEGAWDKGEGAWSVK